MVTSVLELAQSQGKKGFCQNIAEKHGGALQA